MRHGLDIESLRDRVGPAVRSIGHPECSETSTLDLIQVRQPVIPILSEKSRGLSWALGAVRRQVVPLLLPFVLEPLPCLAFGSRRKRRLIGLTRFCLASARGLQITNLFKRSHILRVRFQHFA